VEDILKQEEEHADDLASLLDVWGTKKAEETP
jgi:bacterioferritin (cytochrome b1)